MVDIVRTEAYLLGTLFKDGQLDGSITEQDLRDLIVSIRSNQGGGWSFYVDNVRAIEGNAVSISADARTQILCDGASSLSQNSEIQLLGSNIWDTTNNYITPELESAYDVRLTFECKTTTSGTGNYIEIELDIGTGGIGTGPVIYKEIKPLVKGANLIHNMAVSLPLFAKAPFPTTGGSFFITPNVALTLWNVRIYIVRVYKGDT